MNVTAKYVVCYFDGQTWNRLCARESMKSAVIARNQYFGKDSAIRQDLKIIVETINLD